MANFRYKAVTAAGTIAKGSITATSEADAIAQLRGQGHLPLTAVKADNEWWRPLLPSARTPKVSTANLAFATQELAALLGAHLPLDKALAILMELEETRSLRGPLSAVLAAVRDGASLADAFESTGVFPKPFVTMLRAGEHGGNIGPTMNRLADYMVRSASVRDSVVSAMIYPAVLLCTGGLSAAFVLMYVLPEFEPLFTQSGHPIPAATAIALAVGSALRNYWWLFTILACGAYLVLRRVVNTPAYRRTIDRALLRLPMVGNLILKTQIERFSRMLSALLGNGVALPQALLIAGDTLTNSEVAAAVRETAARLKEGEQLAARLQRTGIFPSLVLDMISVGEQTGSLEEMLLKQADLYEHEIKHAIDRLIALLVPVMTVVMGAVVAGLISSILVAILSINDLAV